MKDENSFINKERSRIIIKGLFIANLRFINLYVTRYGTPAHECSDVNSKPKSA